MQTEKMQVLTGELMETQLSQVDLLMAMYPSEDELVIDQTTENLLATLRRWCEQGKPLLFTIPDTLSVGLNLSLFEASAIRTLSLQIDVPLRLDEASPQDAPPLKVRVRQPNWMNKAEVAKLSAGMPEDDIVSAIQHIHDEASLFIESTSQIPTGNSASPTEPITRVWFYFPSLSTREKRDDLVNHAPSYDLTGFVLAGKPGVLCIEGSSRRIDAYMKFIKTESWGDIPAYQKKVSEKYREEGQNVTRVFGDMREITDSLGEKRGERANRGDMKALEAWLTERGLNDAFEKVLM